MKTIDETAKATADAWIAEVTPQPDRAYTVPHPVLTTRLVRLGIIAGLRMAETEVLKRATLEESIGQLTIAYHLNDAAEAINFLIPTPAESAERGETQ